MAWLGMSIPIVTGVSKKPPSKRPGARNIERREKEEREEQTAPDSKPAQPIQNPGGASPAKPGLPDSDRRKLL
jgi:hypothetical protein